MSGPKRVQCGPKRVVLLKGHYPFVLQLLMDSLGGSALALMIACCSASSAHCDETLSTLSYALRAKNIRNKPIVQVRAPLVLLCVPACETSRQAGKGGGRGVAGVAGGRAGALVGQTETSLAAAHPT